MGAIRDAVAIRRVNTMRKRAAEALERLAGPSPDCSCAFCQIRRATIAAGEAAAAEPAPPATRAH